SLSRLIQYPLIFPGPRAPLCGTGPSFEGFVANWIPKHGLVTIPSNWAGTAGEERHGLRTPRRRAGNAVELLHRFEPQLFTRYLYEPISVVLLRDVTEVISRPAQSFFTLGVATDQLVKYLIEVVHRVPFGDQDVCCVRHRELLDELLRAGAW